MSELTDRQREYREVYLRSEHWVETRKAALERAGRRCQVCNGAKNLDVHHRTYERIGHEEPSDLTVLCRGCHDLFHQSGRKTQKAKKPKAAKKKRAKSKQPMSGVRLVSDADRERFDKMREAELERRREEKRARAERRAEVKRRRMANAKARGWRDEQQLPRKDAA